MKRSPRRNSRRAGFTLVEMLVVLGILVLLASMVVPRILSRQKSANIDAAKSQIGAFRGALEHYAIDCRSFPSTDEGLYALVEWPPDLPETVTWKGPYLTGAIPKDPWGNDYQYEFDAMVGTDYDPKIWSFGPDGEDGTADDICSWTQGAGTDMEGDLLMENGTSGTAKRAPREPGALTPGKKRTSSAPPPIKSPAPVIIE